MKNLLSGTASAAVLAVLTTGTAHAQSQTTMAPSAARPHPARAQPGDTPTTVDEIVVTAQKRKQVLQDVPIVVTAVTHQLLQDSGVKDIKDLALLTPGLLVTSTTSEASTTARIRGIGTVGDNPGLKSSVGVVIDGVYRPRNGVGFGDLGDVDQIEVLKGLQGTLFGKSTSAGVINVTTAAPKFTFGASRAVTDGNYDDVGVRPEVTGPLIDDKLAGSLYFGDQQRDGFFDVNTGPGPRTATTDTDKDVLHHARPIARAADQHLSSASSPTIRIATSCAASRPSPWRRSQQLSPRSAATTAIQRPYAETPIRTGPTARTSATPAYRCRPTARSAGADLDHRLPRLENHGRLRRRFLHGRHRLSAATTRTLLSSARSARKCVTWQDRQDRLPRRRLFNSNEKSLKTHTSSWAAISIPISA